MYIVCAPHKFYYGGTIDLQFGEVYISERGFKCYFILHLSASSIAEQRIYLGLKSSQPHLLLKENTMIKRYHQLHRINNSNIKSPKKQLKVYTRASFSMCTVRTSTKILLNFIIARFFLYYKSEIISRVKYCVFLPKSILLFLEPVNTILSWRGSKRSPRYQLNQEYSDTI